MRRVDVQHVAGKLDERLIGQREFKEYIRRILARYNAGLAHPRRPLASVILAGPTGTGKTYACEVLARALHLEWNECLRPPMITIDCEALQLDHEVARLIGAPPGYVGHRETSPMITQTKLQAVRLEAPLAVVLFDEVEKAAPTLQHILLSVLESGSLQLGDGSQVSFGNTILCFTSNLGATEYEQSLRGFGFPGTGAARSVFRHAIERYFTPEFRGRISKIMAFMPFSAEENRRIVRSLVSSFNAVILESLSSDFTYSFRLTDSAIERIIREGMSMQYNARGLRKAFEDLVLDPLADWVDKHDVRYASLIINEKGKVSHAKTAS